MDEQRERIRGSIHAAFDRWGQRSLEQYLRKLRKGGAASGEAYRELWVEQAFLERRAKHPGLARHVLKQTLRSKVLRKHRAALLSAALTSVVAAESPIVKELAKGPSYSHRTLHRLRKKEYPEVFFDKGPSKGDERTESVSTVFGSSPLPKDETSDDAAAYLAFDRARVLSDPAIWEQIFKRASIREVEPEYLESIREFRTECDRELGRLLGQPKMSRETLMLLREELQAHPELAQVLFNHIQSVLAVRWFRARTESERLLLLERDFRLRYTKKDALRAHALIAEVTDFRFASIFLTNMASFSMHNLGLSGDGIHIHEAILELHPDDKEVQAAAWDNIGTCLRELGEYANAIRVVEEARELHRQLGHIYYELVAERNIGEALFRMGRLEDGLARFSEVQARIPELNDTKLRVRVWLSLATSARRCTLFDLEHTSLVNAIEEGPSTTLLVEIQNRLLELNIRPLKPRKTAPMQPRDGDSQLPPEAD